MENDYISREAAWNGIYNCPTKTDADGYIWVRTKDVAHMIDDIPAADVVEEENILKFYYVRSIDEYWIGRRLDTLYYAIYESGNQQWVWAYSRYLPWGEHVVSPTSLWKEYTYPSEPEEIPFTDWLQGFAKKHIAADVRPVVRGKWKHINNRCDGYAWQICSECGGKGKSTWNFCPNCGADMRGEEGGQWLT